GKVRIIVDYSRFNTVLKKNYYPVPSMEEILRSFGDAEWITCLDMKLAYHQVTLSPEDSEKTAFNCLGRSYRYNRLALGLATAPSHFQRIINSVLEGTEAFSYLDDIYLVTKK